MINVLAYTHLWIALGAGGAAVAVLLAHPVSVTWNEHVWAGVFGLVACTGLAYTGQRLTKLRRQPQRIPLQRRNFLMQWKSGLLGFWLIACTVAGAFILLDGGHWMSWALRRAPLLMVLLILTWGYASNPLSGGRGWREIPHLKWPAIAVVWGVSTGWLPLEWVDDTPEAFRWMNLAAQTAFVAGITLPFDVRDLPIDDPALRTVPQLAGSQKTSALAMVLVVLSAVGFGCIDSGWGRAAASGVAGLGVLAAGRVQKEWVCSLWLDGCLILQGVFAFLSSDAGF